MHSLSSVPVASAHVSGLQTTADWWERCHIWSLDDGRSLAARSAFHIRMPEAPSWKFELEVHTSTSKNSVTINNKLQFEYLMKTNAILDFRWQLELD